MKNEGTVTLKDQILKDVQIVLWGIVAILCAVLLILESIPVAKAGTISVKERITVSSALINKAQQTYTSAVSGRVYNPSDETVRVDRINITVKGDSAGREVEVEGFSLPPRTEREIYASWEGLDSFSKVTRVSATVEGDTQVITNANQSAEKGPVVVFFCILVLAVFLLIRAAKGRYYLWQESKLK